MGRRSDVILLFDVDGTLTKPRQVIDPDMYSFLMNEVKPKVLVGLVGGSDLEKILEQMGTQALGDFDFVFSENGLVAHEHGKAIGTESIQNFMGEEKLQRFINFCLGYMSKLRLPVKRGTFIEFRKGLINVCPVGRSCSQTERDQFSLYDQEHKIREGFVGALKSEFPGLGLRFSIGGQISFDAFPDGWDKTFCLKFLQNIPTIYFFGDKTKAGENDYEIYQDKRTIGISVSSPAQTREKVSEILSELDSTVPSGK